MTIKELKTQLEGIPEDAVVLVESRDHGVLEADVVSVDTGVRTSVTILAAYD